MGAIILVAALVLLVVLEMLGHESSDSGDIDECGVRKTIPMDSGSCLDCTYHHDCRHPRKRG